MRITHILLVFVFAFGALAQSATVSRQIPSIKKICEIFARDGRDYVIFDLMNSAPLKDPTCAACKPLTLALKSSCKASKQSSDKKQRTPHPELLYWSVKLAESINQDRNAGAIWQAFDKLVILLTANFENRSPAEKEYFRHFSDFLYSAKEESKVEIAPPSNVDSLFN